MGICCTFETPTIFTDWAITEDCVCVCVGGGCGALTQGSWQEGAALDVVEVLRLHLLLVGLPVVEVVEVGDNDWDGERDGEDARYRTQ